MHELDFESAGFEWIDADDSQQSVVSYLRKGSSTNEIIVVVGNFTPVARGDYRVGVPRGGYWREMLNSDATIYAGSGLGNMGGVEAAEISSHGRPFSIGLTLPPLSILFLKSEPPSDPPTANAVVSGAVSDESAEAADARPLDAKPSRASEPASASVKAEPPAMKAPRKSSRSKRSR